LWQKDGVENIVITKGTKCGVFADSTGVVKTFTPIKVEQVCDVTGAGDTFISTFLLSVCAGADLFEAGAIANMASGIVVAKIGTATATKEEILEFYHNVIENNYEKI